MTVVTQAVGCDGVVGPTGKQYDACFVCGGDSRRCITIHGTINTQHLPAGRPAFGRAYGRNFMGYACVPRVWSVKNQ